jgi:hypothetical protein
MRGDQRSAPPASLVSVYDGRQCIGHLVGRGPLGVEAYDQHDRSIGLFETAPLAASALVGAGGER